VGDGYGEEIGYDVGVGRAEMVERTDCSISISGLGCVEQAVKIIIEIMTIRFLMSGLYN